MSFSSLMVIDNDSTETKILSAVKILWKHGKPENSTRKAAFTSRHFMRMKKNEQATFMEDLKDHISEFIHASMDEHVSCARRTIQKVFGMSKSVAERNSETVKEVESSLPLWAAEPK